MSGIPGFGEGQFTLGVFTYMKVGPQLFLTRQLEVHAVSLYRSADYQVALQVRTF
jgi:hypothetical protein